jgi:acylaminoacyl-peptidase
MIACYQRQSSLFMTEIDKLMNTKSAPPPASAKGAVQQQQQQSLTPICSHTLLTPDVKIARSARFANSKKMIFVGSKTGFSTHGGTTCLFSSIIGTGKVEVVVDVVRRPNDIASDNSFPGLYIDVLPRQPFLFKKGAMGEWDDSMIVVSTLWGSKESICTIDLSTGNVQRIDFLGKGIGKGGDEGSGGLGSPWNDHRDMSCQLLDCCDGKVLFSLSSPSASHQIGLLDVVNSNKVLYGPPAIKSAITSKLPKLTKKLMNDIEKSHCQTIGVVPLPLPLQLSSSSISDIKWKLLKMKGDDGIPFESILITPPLRDGQPKRQRPIPLIVVPHGGPHAVMSTQFFPTYAFLSLYLDAAVLHVNFRGSTGFGQDSIDSLAGTIATNDVLDVVQATSMALDEKDDDGLPMFDKSKTAVVGGSHGGFLAAHLVGQHPSLFKAACLRNPVINIPGMATTTDIPDWCQVEVNGLQSYDFSTFNTPTPQELVQMHKCSPVAYVNNVVTPTLICLGLKDRRVPSSQGLEFFQLLRARGKMKEVIHTINTLLYY